MTAHKFKVGETVTVVRRWYDQAPNSRFQIVRLLPEERGERQYRLRSILDGHERVVVEAELA